MTKKISNQFQCYVLLGSLGFSLTVEANPQGGQVVSGSANIVVDGLTTEIQQSTQSAIINWDSFNINANEHTHFAQPNAGAMTLNRILDGNPSEILGRLSATGQVMLLNPNGILFGQNSRIDLPGILASTLNITNDNFLNKNYQFDAGTANGVIHNQGQIKINDGGYAALLAQQVINEGSIEANLGRVMLASGAKMTVDLDGNGLVNFAVPSDVAQSISQINNSGYILANGGRVQLTAQTLNDTVKGVINMSGTIEANTADNINGEIILSAHDINLSDATFNANATSGAAGVIRVAADNTLYADAGTRFSAQGTSSADGGFVGLAGTNEFTVAADIIIDSAQGDQGWLYLGDDTAVARYIENPNNLKQISQNADGTYSLQFEYYDSTGEYKSRGINTKTVIGEDTTYFAVTDENGEITWISKSFLQTNEESSVSGELQGAGVTNYLLANQAPVTGIKHYKRVRRSNVYDGIDQVYYGNSQSDLEYDMVVQPGADYKQIAFSFDDADKVELTTEGHLKVWYGDQYLIQNRPVSYQVDANGVQNIVASNYVVDENNVVRFEVASYDTTRELIIDPVVDDPNFGSTNTLATEGVFDSLGNSYVAGDLGNDVFITKIGANGQAVYTTVYGSDHGDGGAGGDTVNELYLAADGSLHMMGVTDGNQGGGFAGATLQAPGGTAGAFVGGLDIFYMKVNADSGAIEGDVALIGDSLVAMNDVQDFVVSDNGDVTFFFNHAGGAVSNNNGTGVCPFASCATAVNRVHFSLMTNSGGTYTNVLTQQIPGTSLGSQTLLALDSDQNLYMAMTALAAFDTVNPATLVDYRPSALNDGVGFIKMAQNDPGNTYSLSAISMYGGIGAELAYDIAVDNQGNSYIGGTTSSSDLFVTADAYQTSLSGVTDAMLTKLDSNGLISYSTFYGTASSVNETFESLAVDASGNVFAAGLIDAAGALEFAATTANSLTSYAALNPIAQGNGDIQVVAFNPTLGNVMYADLIGGAQDATLLYDIGFHGDLSGLEGGTLKVLGRVGGSDLLYSYGFTNIASSLSGGAVGAIEAALDGLDSVSSDAVCGGAIII